MSRMKGFSHHLRPQVSHSRAGIQTQSVLALHHWAPLPLITCPGLALPEMPQRRGVSWSFILWHFDKYSNHTLWGFGLHLGWSGLWLSPSDGSSSSRQLAPPHFHSCSGFLHLATGTSMLLTLNANAPPSVMLFPNFTAALLLCLTLTWASAHL